MRLLNVKMQEVRICGRPDIQDTAEMLRIDSYQGDSYQGNLDEAVEDLVMITGSEGHEMTNNAAQVVHEDNVSDDESIVAKNQEYIFPSPEEVEKSAEPSVGMVFESLTEAQRYLNVHGLLNGYAIRKGTNYLKKTYQLECNRSGKPKVMENAQRIRRRNYILKTGCKMKVIVKLINGKWVFTKVDSEHNHNVVSSPSLTKFLLNHKRMTEDEKAFSKILQDARIKPMKIMSIFRELKGSFKNVFFNAKNLDNLKQKERIKTRNSDIETTVNYLKKVQNESPGFYYTMRMDEENIVRSIFWTDARGRMDYDLYGDFISFDTTFSTNRYNMPFAPIVGINGHGKNVIFGCALIENQTAETFEWVFRTFVETMSGKKPKIIMTDQDAAMKKAIANYMPDVIHRLCIWHIMKNLHEKCGCFMSQKHREGMEKRLNELVYDSLHVAEFESGWQTMLQDYDAEKNEHLQLMYRLRKLWVPVYFKDTMCPFIHSTSRSESTNSYFKDYVIPKDTIENFMRQFEIIQEAKALPRRMKTGLQV